MGAPVGNTNAANATAWKEAVRRALAHDAGTVDDGLLKIAKRLVRVANDEGANVSERMAAWTEIGNRLDGKPTQTIAGDATSPLSITISQADSKL